MIKKRFIKSNTSSKILIDFNFAVAFAKGSNVFVSEN